MLTGEAIDVYRTGASDRYVGQARVVRKEFHIAPCDRYGFKFIGRTANWLLHEDNESKS